MTERAFDPEFTKMLALLPTTIEWGTPEEMPAMREAASSFSIRVDQRDDVIREDREIPGRDGEPDIRVRIYRSTAEVEGLMPGLVEIHGGGFITGDLEMMDAFCDVVAAEFPAVVISVDYRLAPEDPFPAGVEDCYGALAWFSSNLLVEDKDEQPKEDIIIRRQNSDE